MIAYSRRPRNPQPIMTSLEQVGMTWNNRANCYRYRGFELRYTHECYGELIARRGNIAMIVNKNQGANQIKQWLDEVTV